MPDREKVIKDLEAYRDRDFIREGKTVFDSDPRYRKMIINNAIALLKEQEDEKPVLDEFGRCFLNALKRQLDMKLQMIELLITPEFAEKVVELIEKMFD